MTRLETMGLAWRIARRELRSGLSGFRIFLICLALGVASIAGVGTVRSAIEAGLAEQGTVLLGGDAQVELTYRLATDAERDWMAAQATRVSEVLVFRSMAVTGTGDAEDRALTEVKAVDDLYPLTGSVGLEGAADLASALAPVDGVPGAVLDRVLVDRLALRLGDTFRLGVQSFRLGAVLTREPDSSNGGFALGPRTLVKSADLAQSGLLSPGSLYETQYRLDLPESTDLAVLQTLAETQFENTGMRWKCARRATHQLKPG